MILIGLLLLYLAIVKQFEPKIGEFIQGKTNTGCRGKLDNMCVAKLNMMNEKVHIKFIFRANLVGDRDSKNTSNA